MKITHFKNNFIELYNYDVSFTEQDYFKYLLRYDFKILNEPSKEKFLHKLSEYSFIYNVSTLLYITVKKINENFNLKILINFKKEVEVFDDLTFYNLNDLNVNTNKIIRKYKILDLSKDV